MRKDYFLFTVFTTRHMIFYYPFVCNIKFEHFHCKKCKATFKDRSNFVRHLVSIHEYDRTILKNEPKAIFKKNKSTIVMNKSNFSAYVFMKMIKTKIVFNISNNKLHDIIKSGMEIQTNNEEELKNIPSNTSIFYHQDTYDKVQFIIEKNKLKNELNNNTYNILSDHSHKFKHNLHSILISYFIKYKKNQFEEKQQKLKELLKRLEKKENKALKKQIISLENNLNLAGEVIVFNIGVKNGDGKTAEDIIKNIKEAENEFELNGKNCSSLIGDYHPSNPKSAKILNINFVRCSLHLLNISYQKVLKNIFSVTNFKNFKHNIFIKKLIKIILKNFIIVYSTEKLIYYYNNGKNNYLLDLKDFKNIFLNNENVYNNLIEKIRKDKKETIKKPNNIVQHRFLSNGSIHKFLLKYDFLLSDLFIINLSTENNEESEILKKFFIDKKNILNIFLIGLLYLNFEKLQIIFRKSNIIEMRDNITIGLNLLSVKEILNLEEYKKVEIFLNKYDLKEEFIQKLKNCCNIAAEELKKLMIYYTYKI
jgi:uncharacterized C2H2 Zn-finger protein